jgi:hypothetical protein
MRILLVVNASNPHLRRVESAASLINGCQRFYRLDVVSVPEFARSSDAVWPETLAREVERKWPDHYAILITEDSFNDNWFSHEYRTSAVITICDWESIYAPPSIRAYMMYEVAQALIHFTAVRLKVE